MARSSAFKHEEVLAAKPSRQIAAGRQDDGVGDQIGGDHPGGCVWAYVPQDSAFGVAPGIDAVVRVPELPDREFPGRVTRIADALQSGTRARTVSATPTSSDGASATAKTRRPKGSKLDADTGSNLNAD
jgi:hypothetical protein